MKILVQLARPDDKTPRLTEFRQGMITVDEHLRPTGEVAQVSPMRIESEMLVKRSEHFGEVYRSLRDRKSVV